MLKEFKEFALRGNVMDMAVGVIIGAAFSTIVKSLVDDIIMPPIGVVTGGVDFSSIFIPLNGHYEFACRGSAGRRADREYRPLHQQRDQLPDRGLRPVHGDQGHEPASPQAGGESGKRAAAFARGGTAHGNPGRPGQAQLGPHSTIPSPSLGVNKFCVGPRLGKANVRTKDASAKKFC